jgi:hypothetical protein
MSPRLLHAARFALPTVVTVLVAAVAYETVAGILRGPPGARELLAANMPTWGAIAVAMAVLMFLLRLSDVVARPPSWPFAWLEAMWVALACVLAVGAVEDGRVGRAAGIAVGAMALWIAVHRRIPGWPGAFPPRERDLP